MENFANILVGVCTRNCIGGIKLYFWEGNVITISPRGTTELYKRLIFTGPVSYH